MISSANAHAEYTPDPPHQSSPPPTFHSPFNGKYTTTQYRCNKKIIGRAGATGLALTFFTDKSTKLAGELITILREARQEVPHALVAMNNPRAGGGSGTAGGRYGGG